MKIVSPALCLLAIVYLAYAYDKNKINEKYAKEIAEQKELIAKHHQSKSGHLVISSYEECMAKKDRVFNMELTRSACIESAMGSVKLMGDKEFAEEGARHLREYIFEADEFDKKINSSR